MNKKIVAIVYFKTLGTNSSFLHNFTIFQPTTPIFGQLRDIVKYFGLVKKMKEWKEKGKNEDEKSQFLEIMVYKIWKLYQWVRSSFLWDRSFCRLRSSNLFYTYVREGGKHKMNIFFLNRKYNRAFLVSKVNGVHDQRSFSSIFWI